MKVRKFLVNITDGGDTVHDLDDDALAARIRDNVQHLVKFETRGAIPLVSVVVDEAKLDWSCATRPVPIIHKSTLP